MEHTLLKKILFIFIFLLLVITGCVKPPPPETKQGYPPPYKIGNNWYQPLPDSRGFTEEGIASWYGKDFHGKKTSSGEVSNMHGVSAAHKTLPLGTMVRVHNLENNKKLNVRINDRGPFIEGRIIDLSYGAAKMIGVAAPGTARVKIMALNIVKSNNVITKKDKKKTLIEFKGGDFYIQVGAFKERQNAESLKKTLPIKNKIILITTEEQNGVVYHKVKVVGIKTFTKALEYEKYLLNRGYKGIFIVAK